MDTDRHGYFATAFDILERSEKMVKKYIQDAIDSMFRANGPTVLSPVRKGWVIPDKKWCGALKVRLRGQSAMQELSRAVGPLRVGPIFPALAGWALVSRTVGPHLFPLLKSYSE